MAVPLWRVCRVLANRVRLRMLLLVDRRAGLRVSEVARAMRISRPAASQYLRALETCGFVRARRVRRSVIYELARSEKSETGSALLEAVMNCLAGRKKSIEAVFKLATAFANCSRIEVYRSLESGPKSLGELKSQVEWSRWTLRRHLEKLKRRGFVQGPEPGEIYERATVADEFRRALARAAMDAEMSK